jgi:hypothetical protein
MRQTTEYTIFVYKKKDPRMTKLQILPLTDFRHREENGKKKDVKGITLIGSLKKYQPIGRWLESRKIPICNSSCNSISHLSSILQRMSTLSVAHFSLTEQATLLLVIF